MNKLESFDNNKIKCKGCGKYFEKDSMSLDTRMFNYSYNKGNDTHGYKCEKCWSELFPFMRQTGKSMLTYNLLKYK